MKIINFSVVEKLQSLLDKSCSQTIRPAWKKGIENYDSETGKKLDKSQEFNWYKPPRFKVGEEVKLMWNQRSKYKSFWRVSGNPKTTVGCYHKEGVTLKYETPFFNKTLGTAKITEVFKIEIGIGEHCGYYIRGKDSKNLAKKDGFNSVDELFSLFDDMYDLMKPKEFWVYRWKYKKGD